MCFKGLSIGRQAVADINAHDPSTPLFMFFASHSIHEPYEAPLSYLEKFKSVDVEVRQYYDAMVNHVDDVIGTIVAALKEKGMWDNTLIICTSDNVCNYNSRSDGKSEKNILAKL